MQNDYSEQRRFPRFHYSIPIKYHQQDQAVPAYTVTRDLSVGGIKLLANHFIPRGTGMQIEVDIPRLETINASAKVVWSSRISHTDEYLCGLNFSNLGETDKKNISELVSYALKH